MKITKEFRSGSLGTGAWAAGLCLAVLVLLAGGAARAAVAPGDYCVVGVGANTDATADGWLAILTPAGGVTDITPSLITPLIDPWDCAIDPTNGDVIIVDEGPNGAGTDGVLYRVSIVGAVVTQTTLHAGAPLVNPYGVAVGSDGTIYLGDLGAATNNNTNDGAAYSFPPGGPLTRLDTAGVALQNPIDVDPDPRPFTGTSPGLNLAIIERRGGVLRRVPLSGGAVVTLPAAMGGNNWRSLEVGPYGNYFLTRDGNDVERYDRLTANNQQIASGGNLNAPSGITVDYYTADLVVADLNTGVINVPPNVYLGGGVGTTVVAAPGALPGADPAGIGFSPPPASANPSANLGVPTRRAPLPGGTLNPIGPTSATGNGDLESELNLFIEVTSTASPLMVRLFDPNIRDGFDGNSGSFNTPVTYTLFDPSGAALSSASIAGNGGVSLDQRIVTLDAGGVLTLRGGGIPLVAGATGLYRLRVHLTGDNDWNGLGVWVEDFHVYTFTATVGPLHGIGPAPNLTPMDPARLFPYLDRGCEYGVSNFDADVATNPGISSNVTTRLGQVFPLTLSGQDVHAEDNLDPSPGASAASSIEVDYGLHRIEANFSPNATENNIIQFRSADFQGWVDDDGAGPDSPVPPGNAPLNPTVSLRGSPGPAFPQSPFGAGTNTFLRYYLPRYDETPAAAAVPYAPYALHAATPLAGDPPAAGSTANYTVQITVVNPDPVNALSAVTVTAPVPAPTVYISSGVNVNGPATATSGGVVTTCGPTPCSGNITATWATIAAGSAETLSYAIQIAPTVAAQRLYLSGGPAFRGGGATPAANAAPTPGTTVGFTPAWSSGAFPRSESLGPLCDLSVVEGTVTPVAVALARFDAVAGDGEALVVWETAAEFDNLGFRLYRRLEGQADFSLLTPGLILGQGTTDLSASYAYHDLGLPNGIRVEYLLEDIEFDGDTSVHGPVSAITEAGALPLAPDPARYASFTVGESASTGLSGAEAGSTSGDEPTLGESDAAPLASTGGPSVVGAASGGMEILEEDASHLLLEITVPPTTTQPVVVDGTTYTRVEVEGYDTTLLPGFPELPARTLWLEIPDVALIDVTVRERDASTAVLDAPVLPVPTPVAEGGGARSIIAPDPAAYLSSAPFPTESALLAGSSALADGRRLVALRVQPARFTAVPGSLETTTRLRVQMDLRGPAPSLAAVAAAEANQPNQQAVAAIGALKIHTRGRGLVSVDGASLMDAGLDPGVDPRNLQVYRQGVPVAVRLEGESDGVLDAADLLLFFAEGFEDRYGETEVFYAMAADTPGLRAEVLDGAPNGPAAVASVAALGHFEEQSNYLPGVLNGEGDNFVGAYVFDRVVTSLVPSPAPAPGEATLRVRLRGGTSWSDIPDDHHFTVRVAGVSVIDARFDGVGLFDTTVPLPDGLHSGDVTPVEVVPQFDTGAPFDLIYIDALQLDYRRSLELREADAGQLLFAAESTGPVEVHGLATPVEARVWDVTGPDAPAVVTGVQTGLDNAFFEVVAGRRYLVVDGGAERAPFQMDWNHPSNWAEEGAGHGADWLAIAHPSLVAETRVLAMHREGLGLATTVVAVDDVYDEMSGGRATPVAIRDFVRRVNATWNPAPRYLLLVGDATYDYRDFLGGASANLVPSMLVDTTFVEAASDSYFALLDDADEAPDLAVGRIPVETPEDLEGVVAKIVAYEGGPATGAWRTEFLLVADDGLGAEDPLEAEAFEASLDEVAARTPPGFGTTRVELRSLPDATEGDDANAAIRAALEAGTSLALYSGHGGARLWADELIFGADDFDSLTNARLPLFLVLNCLSGFFDAPNEESFGEVVLEASDRGGIAVISSTTVTAFAGQDGFASAVADRLLGANVRLVGDVVQQAMQSIAGAAGGEDVLRSFVLLGDPATALGIPLVPIADAGSAAEVAQGAVIELDGSGSHAPGGGPLGYAWSIVGGPEGSVLLSTDDPARPLFLSSVPGDFSVSLVVNSGDQYSAADTVAIRVQSSGWLSCGSGGSSARLSGFELFYLAIPLALSASLQRRRSSRRRS